MNEVIKELFERKSVRVYSDKMINYRCCDSSTNSGEYDFVFNH